MFGLQYFSLLDLSTFFEQLFSVDLNPPGVDLIRVHLKHILDGSANFKIQQMLWLIFGQLLQIFWAFWCRHLVTLNTVYKGREVVELDLAMA